MRCRVLLSCTINNTAGATGGQRKPFWRISDAGNATSTSTYIHSTVQLHTVFTTVYQLQRAYHTLALVRNDAA
jgi:hypothetical protein